MRRWGCPKSGLTRTSLRAACKNCQRVSRETHRPGPLILPMQNSPNRSIEQSSDIDRADGADHARQASPRLDLRPPVRASRLAGPGRLRATPGSATWRCTRSQCRSRAPVPPIAARGRGRASAASSSGTPSPVSRIRHKPAPARRRQRPRSDLLPHLQHRPHRGDRRGAAVHHGLQRDIRSRIASRACARSMPIASTRPALSRSPAVSITTTAARPRSSATSIGIAGRARLVRDDRCVAPGQPLSRLDLPAFGAPSDDDRDSRRG